MADYPGWLVIVMPAALALGLGGLFALLRRPAGGPEGRRRRMLALAGELRLRYYGSVGAEALSSLPACALFRKARSDGLHNLMAENRNPPGALVFDYGSAAGPARADAEREGYDQPPLYLVALVRLPAGVRVTPARVYRRDWFGGPLGEVDLYSVRLPDAERFGADFLMAGQPPDAVAGMLSEPVRGAVQSWTGRRPHPAVELMPGWVAAYVESEPGDRDAAQRAAGLFHYASAIAAALGSAIGSAHGTRPS